MVSLPPRAFLDGGFQFGFRFLFYGGQKYVKGGSLAGLAFNFNPALVLLDDAIDGRQAKTGAFADGFCREKRLKNMRQLFGVNARAGIRNAQANKFAGPAFGMVAQTVGAEIPSSKS